MKQKRRPGGKRGAIPEKSRRPALAVFQTKERGEGRSRAIATILPHSNCGHDKSRSMCLIVRMAPASKLQFFSTIRRALSVVGWMAFVVPGLLQAKPFSVVVYNVENLFDADGVAIYEDYQPEKYTPAHMAVKLQNIALALSRVDGGDGPAIVVLNEIELDQTPESKMENPGQWVESHRGRTLEGMLLQDPLPDDLKGVPATVWLLKALDDAGLRGYSIAETDEAPGTYEDGRGIAVRNVILSRFPIEDVRTHRTPNARAILEAKVSVEGHPLHVFANHWKSGAGDLESENIRIENAKTLRSRVDEILKEDPSADILIAGDLNSHYNQNRRYREMRTTGISDVLGSQGNEIALLGGRADLYNLWFELPSDQRGSDIYQGEWGTLMHLIVSRGLYDQRGVQYQDNSFAVLKMPGLNADVFGRPVRWSRGSTPSGFSDHYPIYARFRTVDTNAPDQFLALKSPSETPHGTGEPVRVNISPVDLFENSVDSKTLPPNTDLRDGSFTGRVFKLDVPARIDDRGRIFVEVLGLEYVLFTHDRDLRREMRSAVDRNKRLRLFGELGQFRKEWQFLLHGREWFPGEAQDAPEWK